MNSGSTQFVPSRRMGLCDPIHQIAMWDDFKNSSYLDSPPQIILEFDAKPEQQQSEENSHEPNRYDRETTKPDKVQRRLAQNREAARKSRLRKKAYVQKLETCKQRLIQLEGELNQARKQGFYIGDCSDNHHPTQLGTVNQSVVIAFEKEYKKWVEVQNRHINDLRRALESDMGAMELSGLISKGMRHYSDLFTMKASVARADVFYLMSGLWSSSAERFFFWIGGFRPSELLKLLGPHLEPLSEQQRLEISNLRQSCQQAEDALSQGMEKLHQIVADTISGSCLGEEGNCLQQINSAVGNLESLVRFVGQADHLRHETLQQISRMLSPHQAAKGLLAFGDYFQRLQTLSSVWSTRPHQ
ncbi:hypothetical protein M569_11002, partial [Genlisea aurea]